MVDEKPLPQSGAIAVSSAAPAAPLQLPSALRQSGSFSSSSSQAQQQAQAGFALPFSLSTILIGVGLLLLLLVFLFLRVSAMETQLVSLRGANERLERRLVFLQSFVSALSENVTGTAGALKDQLAHWQAFEAFRRQLAQGLELTRTAAALMDRMVQQQAEYELALSRAVAEQAFASADTTAVLFADTAESGASWGASLVALILTALLAMVADLYLLSGAITFRLLRRNKNH